jgi:hypothetical protein
MRLSNPVPAIDMHEAGAFRPARRRTRIVRAVLVAAALGCLAAAAASARGLDTRAPGLLPSRSTGVVVLDLSLSIITTDYERVANTVRRLVDANSPVGLVVFSDVPYELLPPGTPARELRPLLRLLTAQGAAGANPWVDTFRSGTRISTALQLAAEMLEREQADNGSILLVSDLETAPEDVPQVVRVVRDLRSRGIRMRAVALSPIQESRELFETMLGGPGALSEPPPPKADPRRPAGPVGGGLPTGLLVLGGLVFAALAAHERFAGRLALPRPQEGKA